MAEPNKTLTRIDILDPLEAVLTSVAGAFQLGSLTAFSLIDIGFQDGNVDITTSNGRYVVKIFSSEKTKKRIEDVVWGYTTFGKSGIPLPIIRKSADGNHIYEVPGKNHPSYLCVFDFFEGKPLTATPVADADLAAISRMLPVIHRSTRSIEPFYDAMSIANMQNEFSQKKDVFFADELELLQPVIKEFRTVKFATLRQSVIHGTIEKENILKNGNGELCLLDLGCMNNGTAVSDLATFIANFSVYQTDPKRSQTVSTILDAYNEVLPLTKEELKVLPILVRIQYASYIIGMTHHMRKEHDMSKQTQNWLDRSWFGLRAYRNMKHIA